jgi:transcriptional regulator with XRE-family HTH domain
MTPEQMRKARHVLGLTLAEMARLLGYDGEQARGQMHNLETGKRDVRPAQRRLMEAYLAGYRPEDWPPER